jgi:hypothetical protein
MKTSNRFYNNKNNNNNNNNNNDFKPNRFVSKQVNEERSKKQKEEEFLKSLHSSESFPELSTNKNKNNDNNESQQRINYMNAMNNDKVKENKHENKNDKNDKTDDLPPPGCVCIQYDKKTKQQVWIYGKNTTSISSEEKEENPYDVFQRFVNVYQTRKYEYIRNWGFDDYDKMFLYQNYDYEYFDKLDEDIERDMESYYQSNTYSNNYDNDYDNREELY